VFIAYLMSAFLLETHLEIHLPDQQIAEEYYACIMPELGNSHKGRAIMTSSPPHDGVIKFSIKAKDFSAARIAYNSIINYFKLVDEAFNLAKIPKV